MIQARGAVFAAVALSRKLANAMAQIAVGDTPPVKVSALPLVALMMSPSIAGGPPVPPWRMVKLPLTVEKFPLALMPPKTVTSFGIVFVIPVAVAVVLLPLLRVLSGVTNVGPFKNPL